MLTAEQVSAFEQPEVPQPDVSAINRFSHGLATAYRSTVNFANNAAKTGRQAIGVAGLTAASFAAAAGSTHQYGALEGTSVVQGGRQVSKVEYKNDNNVAVTIQS